MLVAGELFQLGLVTGKVCRSILESNPGRLYARDTAVAGNWRYRVLCVMVVLLALPASLPACKRSEQGQLPAVSGEAIKATREEIKGFGLARAYPDQSKDSLALALEFTRPLVGTQDFDNLVTSRQGRRRKGSWALDDDGKTLRFPFVQADASYTVRIKGELAAVDGTILGTRYRGEGLHRPMQPAVGFASQGSVLPARETRGLPVVSVNVKEVDVEFLRVRDKDRSEVLRRVPAGGRKGSWELGSDYDDKAPVAELAESVYVNRFVLGGKHNERTLNYLPIQNITELQEPGLYFAVMKTHRPVSRIEYETAFFFVSDIGLHTRAYKDKLFVHAASLKAASRSTCVELSVLDAKGEAILTGDDRRDGNVQLAYALNAEHVLVAARARTFRCCRSTSRRWIFPTSRSPAASRPGSTCSAGPIAICTVRAKRSACRRCCATTTAIRDQAAAACSCA